MYRHRTCCSWFELGLLLLVAAAGVVGRSEVEWAFHRRLGWARQVVGCHVSLQAAETGQLLKNRLVTCRTVIVKRAGQINVIGLAKTTFVPALRQVFDHVF